MTVFFLLDFLLSVSVSLVPDHTLFPDRVLMGESVGHKSVCWVTASSASLDSKSETYFFLCGF